jgi:hypothetical protein
MPKYTTTLTDPVAICLPIFWGPEKQPYSALWIRALCADINPFRWDSDEACSRHNAPSLAKQIMHREELVMFIEEFVLICNDTLSAQKYKAGLFIETPTFEEGLKFMVSERIAGKLCLRHDLAETVRRHDDMMGDVEEDLDGLILRLREVERGLDVD